MDMKHTERISTSDILGDTMKRLATELGRIPTLEELRSNTSSPRGGTLSNGSLYHAFGPHGNGGINDFAEAHGIYPAVIVDGTIYSSAYKGTPEDLELSPVQPTSPSGVPERRVEDMPMNEIIGLLGEIATEVQRRGAHIQQIIGG
jgi:hypothetical protein